MRCKNEFCKGSKEFVWGLAESSYRTLWGCSGFAETPKSRANKDYLDYLQVHGWL